MENTNKLYPLYININIELIKQFLELNPPPSKENRVSWGFIHWNLDNKYPFFSFAGFHPDIPSQKIPLSLAWDILANTVSNHLESENRILVYICPDNGAIHIENPSSIEPEELEHLRESHPSLPIDYFID